jgi:regulator of sigma E protease
LLTLLVLVSMGLAPVPADPPQDPLGWGYLGVAPAAGGLPLRLGTVQPETPADKAGLQIGDELISVGKLKAKDWLEITEFVCRSRPGTLIQVKVRRNGEEKAIWVRLGTRPMPPELPIPEFRHQSHPSRDQ